MYEQIIVGYDGSDESADALAFGALVAESTGGTLVPAQALPLDADVAEAAAGISVLPNASPVHGLHDLAEERHADLIVVGSTHRATAGTVLLGSVGQRLLESAPCAVAVVPRGFRQRASGVPRVIAVAFDGSAESKEALHAAAELAAGAQATLRLVAVHTPTTATARGWLDDELHLARDELPGKLRAAAELFEGSAAAVIAAEADKGVDALFLGSRGHGPLRRAVLGSVSSELMRTAPCPVVVTPRAAVHEDALAAQASAESSS